MSRTIETIIRLSSENEYRASLKNVGSDLKVLKSELDTVTSEFRNNANSMEALTAKGDVLKQMYDKQQEKLGLLNGALEKTRARHAEESENVARLKEQYEAAQKALAEYGDEVDKSDQGYQDAQKAVKQYHDELSKATAKLDSTGAAINKYTTQANRAQIELNKLDDEVQENNRLMDEARSSADGCARSIDRYGKAVADAADEMEDANNGASGFGDFLKADLISEGAQAIVEGLREVVEETREYRKIMGSLNESSVQAGYSATETAEAYTRLFSVLADDQSAATTAANLQALQLPQEQLMELINGTIGGWAKYGDSIPIDGLAEAINHTAKLGEVQGTFADILEWSGVSVDSFNARLSTCKTMEERVQLIMEEMTRQNLPAMGNAWQQNNKTIVESNEANAKLQAQMARLAETIEPLFTAMTNGAAWALEKVNDLVDGIKAAPGVFDLMAASTAIASGDFTYMAEQSMALYDAITDTGEAVEEYNEVLEETPKKHDAVDKSIIESKKQLSALRDAYSSARDSARDSIDQQVGLFDKISQKCQMSTQDMINNLKSQRQAFTDYADNIEKAMARGIDAGLVKKLSDGSVESMQILAQLVNATDEEISALNAEFQGVEQAKDYLADGMAAVSQECLNALVEMGALTEEEAYQMGQDLIDGLTSGVKSKKAEYVSTVEDVARSGNEKYREVNLIASPSRRYREYARYDVEGLIVEYKASKPKLQQATEELANAGYQGMIRSKQASIPTLSSAPSGGAAVMDSRIYGLLQQLLTAVQAGKVLYLDKRTMIGSTVADYDRALGQQQILTERGAV